MDRVCGSWQALGPWWTHDHGAARPLQGSGGHRDSSKRERERGRKSIEKEREKLQESLQIKGEVNILRGEKHFNFENPFYMIPFSPPPSYHF
ncbi:hypothetical protein, partial [Arcobacter sp.]|uniref:hypothetical protein n=1 Tax=Arcobacter sp. TaxID=1872629 RepID=UPI003D0C0000